jgi:hypothetical protein
MDIEAIQPIKMQLELIPPQRYRLDTPIKRSVGSLFVRLMTGHTSPQGRPTFTKAERITVLSLLSTAAWPAHIARFGVSDAWAGS